MCSKKLFQTCKPFSDCIQDKPCSETFHMGDKIFGETFAVKHFVDKTCGETFMLKTRLSVNHFVVERRFSEFTFETRFFGKHFIFATRLGVKQLICIREKTLNSAFFI